MARSRAQRGVDEGDHLAHLRSLLAVPTESRMPDSLPALIILIPDSHAGCHQHGPDEHALAPLLPAGLGLMAGL